MYQVGCVVWCGKPVNAILVHCDDPHSFEVVIYDDLSKLLGWILLMLKENRGDPDSVWRFYGLGAQIFFAAATHTLLTDAAHAGYDPEDGKRLGEMI